MTARQKDLAKYAAVSVSKTALKGRVTVEVDREGLEQLMRIAIEMAFGLAQVAEGTGAPS